MLSVVLRSVAPGTSFADPLLQILFAHPKQAADTENRLSIAPLAEYLNFRVPLRLVI